MLELPLILAIGFSLASLCAYIAERLRLPPLLGYLLSGFLIGPHSPGFVANMEMAKQLAEVGVILMLFGVGIHFKIEDLIRVQRIAIPGAIVQTAIATLVTTLVTCNLGWPIESGILAGIAIGVASTVVLVRVLTDNHILHTAQGHIAMGWLIVEDLCTVVVLVLLPTIALICRGTSPSIMGIGVAVSVTLLKFLILICFMFTWGHKIVASILITIARLRSQELFTITVLALVFLIALGSAYIFGTSIALGAFISGMVVGKTHMRHQAITNALPLKDIFSTIFFLSVGMLFDPKVLVEHFFLFLSFTTIILIVKPISAYCIVRLFRYPVKVARTIALALAQIGEFSFILAEEAVSRALLPQHAFDILIGSGLISIAINPVLFQVVGLLEQHFRRWGSRKIRRPSAASKRYDGKKAVIVGFGPTGREVRRILKEFGCRTTIIEQNIDTVSQVEDDIIFGDASQPHIVQEAAIGDAQYLLITVPETTKALEIIHTARYENPDIRIAVQVHYISEIPLIEEAKVPYVCQERETLGAFCALVREMVREV